MEGFQETKSISQKGNLCDALQIAKLLSNAEDFINHYTLPEIAESGKIKHVPCIHSYKFIINKIARRFEFQSMLEVGKAADVTKHRRKSKEDESEECDARKTYIAGSKKQGLEWLWIGGRIAESRQTKNRKENRSSLKIDLATQNAFRIWLNLNLT